MKESEGQGSATPASKDRSPGTPATNSRPNEQRRLAGDPGGEQESASTERLLRQALPPIGETPDLPRDLWPAMLRKLDERPAAVPWFDWALMGGLAAIVVAFPTAIPMLLYYL